MLGLSRYPGEAVLIDLPDGRTVSVHVHSVQGSRVRLLIGADRDILIRRAELPRREPASNTNRE